ncbi:MAG: SDR family oxidoreductase [Marinobacterium sp.]|nr:SDR family oxidoreductase [Marinobacterium sp.]
MIGITGANGQLGRLVIKALLNTVPANEIVAAVRNPESADNLKALGVQVRKADYSQPDTLTTAFDGVSKLLLISSSEVGQRVPQHRAVIDAAKAAGVKLLAYTSILNADSSPMILAQEHKPTEALIAESAIPAVILRNGWYTENYTQSIAAVLEHGAVAGCAGEGRFSTAARADYAEAAAIVLTSTQSLAGNVYELAGDNSFTLAEYAAEIARQSGKAVGYHNMSETGFSEMLQGIGLPAGFAGALADAETGASNGWLENNNKTLSALLGRPTITLAESVKAALAAH